MASYKEEHQLFMAGHSGTTFIELLFLFSSSCLTCCFRDAVILSSNEVFRSHKAVRFFVDFSLVVLPSLLAMTLFNGSVPLIFACLILTTMVLYFIQMKESGLKLISHQLSSTNLSRRKTFITYFRSIVGLITALAILAVDFKVFPRKFAKTEEFGFGMMDFGVGFFVVSNAVVSAEARGKDSPQPGKRQMRKVIISSLPLFVLAFARLITVKGTDYQEHVTEYGVHWNFFFTLAVLKIFSAGVFSMVPNIKPGISGCLLLLLHQVILSLGLSTYILVGADGKGGRGSLIDANREGIFSLPGYLALYMLSVQLGRFFFQKRNDLWDWLQAAWQLLLATVLMTIMMYTLHFKIQLVSRRFVNAAYILATMIFCCAALLVCLVGDIGKTCVSLITSKQKEDEVSNSFQESESATISTIKTRRNLRDNSEEDKDKQKLTGLCMLEAISFNSLLYFLLANILTGFVNLSISTIHASTSASMLILFVYSLSVCSISVWLYSKNIKTKIW